MIWDLHVHLNGVDGRTPEERMAELIRSADRMGIDRFCLYMGFPFIEDPTPAQLREQNNQALQALSHWHHRAFGFVYLSANHLQFSLDEFNRCVRDGPMVGVKLWVARRASAPELDPIIGRAASLNAVVFQHTWWKTGGNLPGESTPLDIVELARRHPAVPLICGHTGGDWERGIRAIRSFKNISADTAGSDPTAGFVEMAVRELGPERVIYGSDAGGRSFASQLAKVTGAMIPEHARGLILGENLRRMMLPICKAKGIRL
ncbi:MAG: amidohydrolase [Bryobacterales bacterium]|nr:amidohydrolase [Bryobacterales bacterium]